MVSIHNNVGHSPPKMLTYRSLLFWIMTGLLFVFFFVMPFQRGLINTGIPTLEVHLFYSFIIGAILLICMTIYIFQLRINISSSSPYPYLIWIMPIMYSLSMLGAVSSHAAYIEILVWVMYSIFFIVAYHFVQTKEGKQIAFYLLSGSSAIIVIFGMMNWFGDDLYKDAVLISGEDARLTSVFQYPNTYAAYLIAVIFICLSTIVLSKNKYYILISAFMFVPSFISIMLTLSRGGWVVFPIVFLLVLPLFSFTKQIQVIVQFILGTIASMLILPKVNQLGLQLQQEYTSGTAFQAWGLLIGVSLVVAVAAFFIQKYVGEKLDQKLENWNHRKFMSLLFPVLGIATGVLGVYLMFGNTGFTKLLPESIAERIDNINFNQHSVLERGAFYQDAIEIWRDYPLFGAGGGAWAALYQQYQDNPYTSNQVHSFFLQTLVEVGIFGIFMLLILLVVVYYFFFVSYIQKQDEERHLPSIWYIVSTSILIHSIIDFNMTYVYLGVLVFFSLGAMLASSQHHSFTWHSKLLQRKWRWFTPAALMVLAVSFLIVSIVKISVYQQYEHVQQALNKQPVELSLEQLDRAIDRGVNPEFTDYKVQLLMQLYQETSEEHWLLEAQHSLQKIINKEPYYEPFIYRQFELYQLLQKDEEAAWILENGLGKFPWEIEIYEKLAALQFQRSIAAISENQEQVARELLQYNIELLNKVNGLTQQLENLPDAQLQGRVFGVTPLLALSLGQTYYVLGEYEAASQYLATAWDPSFNTQEDVTTALYYSAVLQRLHLPYEEVNHALFSAFPENRDSLEQDILGLLQAEPIH